MPDYLGKDTKKLGFGLMRLPRKGPFTDVEQVKRMVDRFLEAGGASSKMSRKKRHFFSKMVYCKC